MAKQKNLKERTISGMIWSSVGKFGTLSMTFLSNLVLARLLMPSDYGIIGMLHVFIAVSSIFVTAGFGSALIQKKNPTHIDYTSVFYWNLVASIIFYVLLFFCGPLIAQFYNMPDLCIVLRVQSLSLIIQAFSMVQSNQLVKQLRFKELTIRNIIASLIGTVIGIVMAFMGFGVWSLVASALSANVAGVLLLWRMSSWRPTWEFSWQSLRELFSFGGLMALSSFMETIYVNLQSLIIGKWFSAADLGYYTQAKKLEEVPTGALSSVVNQVSFPVFSAMQDDHALLKKGVSKNIKSITYLNFPLMVLLIIIARPLITLLYGAKWEQSIPYFQILCILGIVYTLNTLNTNVIKSLGKSKLFFFVQLAKRLIGIGMIIFGVQFGMFGLLWAVASLGYVCVLINLLVNKRLINYGLKEQLMDVGTSFVLSTVLGVSVYAVCNLLPIHPYLIMSAEIAIYVAAYIGLSRLFGLEAYYTYQDIIIKMVLKKVRRHPSF